MKVMIKIPDDALHVAGKVLLTDAPPAFQQEVREAVAHLEHRKRPFEIDVNTLGKEEGRRLLLTVAVIAATQQANDVKV